MSQSRRGIAETRVTRDSSLHFATSYELNPSTNTCPSLLKKASNSLSSPQRFEGCRKNGSEWARKWRKSALICPERDLQRRRHSSRGPNNFSQKRKSPPNSCQARGCSGVSEPHEGLTCPDLTALDRKVNGGRRSTPASRRQVALRNYGQRCDWQRKNYSVRRSR